MNIELVIALQILHLTKTYMLVVFWFANFEFFCWLFHDRGPYHIETILLCRSMDCFYYDRDLRHERVNCTAPHSFTRKENEYWGSKWNFQFKERYYMRSFLKYLLLSFLIPSGKKDNTPKLLQYFGCLLRDIWSKVLKNGASKKQTISLQIF